MNNTNLFHPGELYLQEKSGVEKHVAMLAPRIILDELTSAHKIFYSKLKILFIGSVDEEGQPWASVLSGPPGFIKVRENNLISINAKPVTGDPLGNNLDTGSHLGLLGLDFATRLRNRITSQVKSVNNGKINLSVKNTFGNCPKYIQTRDINTFTYNNTTSETHIQKIKCFDKDIQQLISLADTFFIASYYPYSDHRGADVSHRGGKPGFVKIEDEYTLSLNDYTGNNAFMTLGNLHSNPVAGLLFIDFDSGDLLQIACSSEIIDTPGEKYARQIKLRLKYGWLLKNALCIESDFIEYSPFLE